MSPIITIILKVFTNLHSKMDGAVEESMAQECRETMKEETDVDEKLKTGENEEITTKMKEARIETDNNETGYSFISEQAAKDELTAEAETENNTELEVNDAIGINPGTEVTERNAASTNQLDETADGGKRKNTDSFIEGRNKIKCYSCKDVLESNQEYTQHILEHTFSYVISVHQAAKEEIERKTYGESPQCPICDVVFYKKNVFENHFNTHRNGNNALVCDRCDYANEDLKILKKHMEVHLKPVVYKCSDCNGEYAKRFNLDRHWRSHH